MASFSSRTSGLSTNYDVFVNFVGKNTCNNLAVFLQKDLKRRGVKVFIDSEDLRDGEEIQPTLLETIRGSKISFAIFSRDYAESKWCLLELEEIVRCNISYGQKVVPIFLDVEPRDVRNQTGRFGESFRRHMEIFDAQKIQTWKDSLRIVGERKGVELQQVNGDLSRLVELVVNWASRQFSSNIPLNYDVFVSFRGADSGKNNFTAFLHKDLKRVGLNVFMDEQELSVGGSMQHVLLDAIRRSKISIIVLSEHYIDSKWCLQELVEIVRCHRSNGQIILPVFLNVQPNDVRHQSGTFRRSFQHHMDAEDFQTIESWRDALSVVANQSGLKLQLIDGNEPKLLDSIVYHVFRKLNSVLCD